MRPAVSRHTDPRRASLRKTSGGAFHPPTFSAEPTPSNRRMFGPAQILGVLAWLKLPLLPQRATKTKQKGK
jgi:hypothetical protein